MLLGMTAALLAATLFGVVAVVQAAIVRRRGLVTPMMLLVLAIYVTGWVLHYVAIVELPLYLAQVGVGSSLIVTALVASKVMGEPLRPLQWVAVVAMATGLGTLAVAAGPVGESEFTTTTTVVLYVWLVLNTLLGWLAWRSSRATGTLALGILAGAAYGGSPIATRSLIDFSWDLQTIAPALTIGLFGGLGFLLYSEAMKRGAITAATAPVVLQSTVVPAVVGLAAFGDEVREGWMPVAVVAFAASVAAGIVLSRAEASLEMLDELAQRAE